MAELGKFNTLRAVREAQPGLYLDGADLGEILLPWKLAPSGARQGDEVKVFVYRDSEDRFIATSEEPLAVVGEFAVLRVNDVAPGVGAFLGWGLQKDLLLPFREMDSRVYAGDHVVAYVFVDDRSQRILASTRLKDFVSRDAPRYETGQQVNLLVIKQTPLGYAALIERQHLGLIYHSEAALNLAPGDAVQGYVSGVRPDGKIDLTMESSGAQRVFTLTEQILEELKAHGGRIKLDDDSPPEEIRAKFGASKKAFKQAVGALYKQRLIRLTKPGMELVK